MVQVSQSVIEKARQIQCLITDVDGVLTNGQITFAADGEEIKNFHVSDGLGLKLLMAAGIQVAVITAHQSPSVTKRMQQLGIANIYQGISDKLPIYDSILSKLNLKPEQTAYIGDDLPDLKLIRKAGLGCSVANGSHIVQEYADYCSNAEGGYGAVREICEIILTAQDKLAKTIETYL